MPLAPGTKLGPYEIAMPLGMGGMGEVYRAKDTRLDRTVAIKILPAQFSLDPVHKQRFEREAKSISGLSHPHICVLHDVGSQDGVDYLVMECVEGETLAKRLEKGALPLEQVLKYGMQIADALDKAHRSGVVHRDLKPGNIMLTPMGAKLLDFGLAKPAVPLATGATLSAATQNSPVTEQGTIVGTFQYMSPEQIEGKELDGRSDIFSFGAVLYEMHTGRRAFAGKSQLSVASAILEREPDPINVAKPMTPPALEHAVKKCLAKLPEERWQSASDLASELKWVAESSASCASVSAASAEGRYGGSLAWKIAALGLVAVAAFLGYLHWRDVQSAWHSQVVRAFIDAPGKTHFNFTGDSAGPVIVSPDGTKLVFSASNYLWVRSLEDTVPRRLEGTRDAVFPFWSPDSRFIGFSADGKLKTMDISGAPPVLLCDASDPRGASWGTGGTILFEPGPRAGIFRVAATGGAPLPVTKLESSQQFTTHRWPSFLPDGKHFLYLAANHADPQGASTEIYVASLDGKLNRPLMHSLSPAEYASGYLLFPRGVALMAQPFDVDKMEFTGDALIVADNVTEVPSTWGAVFSASQNGVLAYQAGGQTPQRELRWYDRQGKNLGALSSGFYYGPRLSPDGGRLAVDFGDPNRNVWVFDVRRNVKTRLTFGAVDAAPVWSPDGSRVAFSPLFGGGVGRAGIFEKKSNGEGEDETLYVGQTSVIPTDWSPDGRFILLDNNFTTLSDIEVLPLTGDHKPYPFAKSQFSHRAGHFSPDGRWVAYTSNESGREEVYVAPFPGPGGKWQVSSSGGRMPRWRRDGRELYFFADDDALMAAEVAASPNKFEVKNVHPLFRVNLAPEGRDRSGSFDVNGAGSRFIIHTSTDEAQPPITLVLNWPAEVKKK